MDEEVGSSTKQRMAPADLHDTTTHDDGVLSSDSSWHIRSRHGIPVFPSDKDGWLDEPPNALAAFCTWRLQNMKSRFLYQLREINKEIEEDEKEMERLRQKVAQAATREAKLAEALSQAQQEADLCRGLNVDLQAKVGHLLSECKEAQLVATRYQQELTLARESASCRNSQRRDEGPDGSDSLSRAHDVLLKQHEMLLEQLARENQRVAELSSQAKWLEKERAGLQGEVVQLESVLRATGEKTAQAETQVQHQATIIAQLQCELSELRGRHHEALGEMKLLKVSAEGLDPLRSQISHVEGQYQQLLQENLELKKHLDQKVAEKAEMVEAFSAKEAMIRELQDVIARTESARCAGTNTRGAEVSPGGSTVLAPLALHQEEHAGALARNADLQNQLDTTNQELRMMRGELSRPMQVDEGDPSKQEGGSREDKESHSTHACPVVLAGAHYHRRLRHSLLRWHRLTVQSQVVMLQEKVDALQMKESHHLRALGAVLATITRHRRIQFGHLVLARWRMASVRAIEAQQRWSTWSRLLQGLTDNQQGEAPSARGLMRRVVARRMAPPRGSIFQAITSRMYLGLIWRCWRGTCAISRMSSLWEEKIDQVNSLRSQLAVWVQALGDRRRMERAWLAWRLCMCRQQTMAMPHKGPRHPEGHQCGIPKALRESSDICGVRREGIPQPQGANTLQSVQPPLPSGSLVFNPGEHKIPVPDIACVDLSRNTANGSVGWTTSGGVALGPISSTQALSNQHTTAAAAQSQNNVLVIRLEGGPQVQVQPGPIQIQGASHPPSGTHITIPDPFCQKEKTGLGSAPEALRQRRASTDFGQRVDQGKADPHNNDTIEKGELAGEELDTPRCVSPPWSPPSVYPRDLGQESPKPFPGRRRDQVPVRPAAKSQWKSQNMKVNLHGRQRQASHISLRAKTNPVGSCGAGRKEGSRPTSDRGTMSGPSRGSKTSAQTTLATSERQLDVPPAKMLGSPPGLRSSRATPGGSATPGGGLKEMVASIYQGLSDVRRTVAQRAHAIPVPEEDFCRADGELLGPLDHGQEAAVSQSGGLGGLCLLKTPSHNPLGSPSQSTLHLTGEDPSAHCQTDTTIATTTSPFKPVAASTTAPGNIGFPYPVMAASPVRAVQVSAGYVPSPGAPYPGPAGPPQGIETWTALPAGLTSAPGTIPITKTPQVHRDHSPCQDGKDSAATSDLDSNRMGASLTFKRWEAQPATVSLGHLPRRLVVGGLSKLNHPLGSSEMEARSGRLPLDKTSKANKGPKPVILDKPRNSK